MQFKPRRSRREIERPIPVDDAAHRQCGRRLIDVCDDDIAAQYVELRAAGAAVAIGQSHDSRVLLITGSSLNRLRLTSCLIAFLRHESITVLESILMRIGKRPIARDKLERSERLQVLLSRDEFIAIDEFRFENRMPSRAAAVREILRRALTSANGSPRRNVR